MYRPVMDTLVAGFTHLPAAVSAAIGTLNVVSGSGVAAKSPEYKQMMRLARDLGPRDLFLFIGPIGSESVPWDAMRDRGVRTVYYQTEPVNGCALSKARPDEVWDFSWHNLDACKPYPKPWLTQPFQMRYVPMGYIKPPAEARVRGYVPPDDAPELFFFGYPFYKSGRKRCYERLQRALGARLNATWMLWSPMAFERWWRASGRWAAHLNLHKACESARNPVVFRTSILLSRGATVISERANHKERASDHLLMVAFTPIAHPAKPGAGPSAQEDQWRRDRTAPHWTIWIADLWRSFRWTAAVRSRRSPPHSPFQNQPSVRATRRLWIVARLK
jgi:hypothetical protein